MKNKISNIIWNIIASKLPKDYDIEILRKIMLLNIFSILGCFFIFSFGIIALVDKNTLLCIVDFIAGFFLIIYILWIRKTLNVSFSGYIASFVMGLYFLFLIARGASDQTTFLWSFTFPIFTIFILGNRKGIITSLIFLVSVITIFFLGYQIDFFSIYSFNLIIRYISLFLVITFFVFFMEKIREKIQSTLSKANKELKKTLEEVKTLSGLLPICAKCKKIRDDKGYWNQLEGYIQQHSEAEFSHSVCPECSEELYGKDLN